MDHKFDRLAHKQGQMFALRLYLDMLIHDQVGNHPNETSRYLSRLLAVRYSPMLDLFPTNTSICNPPSGIPLGHIPVAQHVYGDCSTDMKLASRSLSPLPPEKRDFLLADYIEEISAQVCTDCEHTL